MQAHIEEVNAAEVEKATRVSSLATLEALSPILPELFGGSADRLDAFGATSTVLGGVEVDDAWWVVGMGFSPVGLVSVGSDGRGSAEGRAVVSVDGGLAASVGDAAAFACVGSPLRVLEAVLGNCTGVVFAAVLRLVPFASLHVANTSFPTMNSWSMGLRPLFGLK